MQHFNEYAGNYSSLCGNYSRLNSAKLFKSFVIYRMGSKCIESGSGIDYGTLSEKKTLHLDLQGILWSAFKENIIIYFLELKIISSWPINYFRRIWRNYFRNKKYDVVILLFLLLAFVYRRLGRTTATFVISSGTWSTKSAGMNWRRQGESRPTD